MSRSQWPAPLWCILALFISFCVGAVPASDDSLPQTVCTTASKFHTVYSTCSLAPGLHTHPEDGANLQGQTWEVRLSPGRGRGVFALQHIKKGALVLAEEPLVAVKLPALVPGVGYDLASIKEDLARQYAGLGRAGQTEFDSCHEHRFPGDAGDEGGRLMAILRSNAYTVQGADGAGRVALYPKAALINHSCQPNVLNGDAAGTRKIIATRDISPGEEIVTTYIPLLMSTQHRQDRLAQYGFACGCHACRTGSSDRRRVLAGDSLSELERAMSAPTEAGEAGRLLGKARDLDVYLADEGFGDYLAKTSRMAFEFANRAHNATSARAWARKYLGYVSMVDAESVEAQNARDVLSSMS